ncbi:hypothetical protein RRG08_052074 [Elysia crispata]|uniref:Uncharacterized protein n=1 Tax=Elysia crispata TaxID=231223 RepID=A0AAE1A4Q6_9GAST|nr:hypothetical protein RRG08_052074 [Elysia crispata]
MSGLISFDRLIAQLMESHRSLYEFREVEISRSNSGWLEPLDVCYPWPEASNPVSRYRYLARLPSVAHDSSRRSPTQPGTAPTHRP